MEYNQVSGAWIVAIGTLISAFGATRELVGLNDINNRIATIGEGMQAVGAMLIGTVATESSLEFAGNWIDGIGAGTSSFATYLQDTSEETGEGGIRLEVLGNLFQSMGASLSALSNYNEGEPIYFKANVLQALGAGLEAIGALYELNEKAVQGQPITAIGAILQASGANLNVVYITKEFVGDY
ncbi:DUF6944 family repetitive protein [Salipaludibacillus sp. HK11]|uniref:DUF6944 family repetitive protein n=1 Tax=Salipaludibacillus sp. HK11 TaxID=3394320 RepID=UPI0039FBED93